MTNDYQSVKADIRAILPNIDWDDSCFLGPVLLRLAWHACGTFDAASKTGGSYGATMRFEPEKSDPENAGLQHARAFLEPIKEKHAWISYADLWTLGGVVAVEAMGGPKINWRPGRQDKPVFERTDSSIEVELKPKIVVPENGRLPQASKGADHVRQVFTRMGFTDQETVALLGAHCVGRCHKDRSGFEGPWTNTPIMFNNSYFKFLTERMWVPKVWNGPMQFVDQDDAEEFVMMLPTDMALLQDPLYSVHCYRYAENNELFCKDFGQAFEKLLELGVPRDTT